MDSLLGTYSMVSIVSFQTFKQVLFWCLDETLSTEVHLPKLEFYCVNLISYDGTSSLSTNVLCTCDSLRYFGGSLEIYQTLEANTRIRLQHAFGNLVALDLTYYTVELLDILADLDDLQLRYFRLGWQDYRDISTEFRGEHARDILEKIVGKLKMLEIFIAINEQGIGNNTIKQFTKMKLNLKLVSFRECANIDDLPERDGWEVDDLVKFSQMLLSNDPELDLSQFCFLVKEESVPQDLKEMNIGFTFIVQGDGPNWYDFTLNDIRIKRRLGINF